MDLGTIKNKLETNQYSNSEEVLKDVQLVWRNAYKYNQKNSQIYKYAKQLSKEFENLINQAIGEGFILLFFFYNY